MKKQILILTVLVITIMACSESATLRPKTVVNKQSFTMNIDGKDWVADSTLLVVSPFGENYTMAVGIKYADKVKKIPAETYYLFIPNLTAGESIKLPNNSYKQADIEYTNDQGIIAASLINDSRGKSEFKILKSDTKGITMTFTANFFIGYDEKVIKAGSIGLYY